MSVKIRAGVIKVSDGNGNFTGISGVVGAPGEYYIPSVSEDGDISWTASASDMPSVKTVNIRGKDAEIDETLTMSEMAADAKITGDMFNRINDDIKAQQDKHREYATKIENLEYAANGYIYRDFVDTTPAYSKKVPNAALPWAMVDMVGSGVVLWNQQRPAVTTSKYVKWSNVTDVTFENGVCSFIATEAGGYIGRIGEKDIDTVVGWHKYLSVTYVKTDSPNVPLMIYTDAGLAQTTITTPDTNWHKVYKFFQYPTNITPAETFSVYDLRSSGWDRVYFKNPMRFDLTNIFGEGNEPTTIEEFERYFPDEYYEYNAGESISYVPDTVISYTQNGEILDTISVVDVPHQINVEAGGIIEFASDNGTRFMIPVQNQETYLIKLQNNQ